MRHRKPNKFPRTEGIGAQRTLGTRAYIDASVRNEIGFAKCAAMPAKMQRSRDAFTACAVMAVIASTVDGIDVHHHDLAAHARCARTSSPFEVTTTRCPRLTSVASATL
jgi:hypothetical protein